MASFVFVHIPCASGDALTELTGDVSGGLENDDVQLYAKRLLAVDMVNICSLGLPSPRTSYLGISMYSHCDGKDSGLEINSRATEIAQACGHLSTIVYGDAFLSRYYDNEDEEWKRLDFHISEADLSSEWIQEVSRMNQGKNMSSYTTGGTLQQILTNSQAAQPIQETDERIKWSQTSDEVEIQVAVPPQTKGKDVKVNFSTNAIVVKISGFDSTDLTSSLKNIFRSEGGRLQNSVRSDECTWSLTNEGTDKFLVITLNKTSPANWTELLVD